jgi:hypothetical protein
LATDRIIEGSRKEREKIGPRQVAARRGTLSSYLDPSVPTTTICARFSRFFLVTDSVLDD